MSLPGGSLAKDLPKTRPNLLNLRMQTNVNGCKNSLTAPRARRITTKFRGTKITTSNVEEYL